MTTVCSQLCQNQNNPGTLSAFTMFQKVGLLVFLHHTWKLSYNYLEGFSASVSLPNSVKVDFLFYFLLAISDLLSWKPYFTWFLNLNGWMWSYSTLHSLASVVKDFFLCVILITESHKISINTQNNSRRLHQLKWSIQ